MKSSIPQQNEQTTGSLDFMGVRGKEIIWLENQSTEKKFPVYQKLLKAVRYLVRSNTRLLHYQDFISLLLIVTGRGQFINFMFSLSVQFLKESFLFKNQETFFRNKYTYMEEISADTMKKAALPVLIRS